MGKLRTDLDNARKLIAGLQKTTEAYSKRLANLSKGASAFMKGGFAAMDELYLYILEKLKKKNIPLESVKNAQIKSLTDSNIKKYLAGIQFIIAETAKFNVEFAAIADDKSIDNTLAALDPLLKSIEDQVRKKKKKLLQSKKFKIKITNYEGTLNSLRQAILECKEDLTLLRGEKPPSLTKLRQVLFATEDTKLVAFKAGFSVETKKLYDGYNSLLLHLNQSAADIREEKEFGEVMKSIKQMVDDADEMEKEGN